MSEPVFSVIAPIYNELENLPLLYARVKEVMDSTGEPWELILVDDGSSDGSTDVMRSLSAEDERVRPVIFARNFGHQIAVTAGIWIAAVGKPSPSSMPTFRTHPRSSSI